MGKFCVASFFAGRNSQGRIATLPIACNSSRRFSVVLGYVAGENVVVTHRSAYSDGLEEEVACSVLPAYTDGVHRMTIDLILVPACPRSNGVHVKIHSQLVTSGR